MALTKLQIKVYAELGTKERINFVTTRKTRQFNLAGTILAKRFVNKAGVTSNTRISVERTDQFNKDGTNRIVYRRALFTRFVNEDEDTLSGDLGYDIDQVIDYINGEANKVEDGFRFLSDGVHVGFAETANFTNGIGVTVQNGIATITPRQIGIATAGGTVGSGVSLFDFRGAGISTVTVNTSSGIGTINITGGTGNPVTSGAVTGSGNTTLTLTLNDASTVDIDVTNLRTITSIGSSTDYFYLNNGAQLSSNTHDSTAGVAFYNRKLQRGEELVFSIPGNSAHAGIWNGGVGIAGTYGAVTAKGNWSVKWQYNEGANDWEASNTYNGPTGVEFNRDIVANNGTYAIRLDHTTQKLQLWQISSSYDWLLSNSASGIGTTESYIYFAAGDPDFGSQLPAVSEVRSQDFTVKSYTDSARPGASFYDGTRTDDVWKSNRSLRPGLKVKFTVPTSAANQYWATAFEGTEDLGSGQSNAYASGEMTWRLTNQEKFVAHTDCTLNTNYTAVDSGNVTTLSLPGRNMSWRYNSDNTWDLFDEDTDEVVISGDDNLGGSDMYPYLLSVNNSTEPLQDYVQYEWDWNDKAWFVEHRDWESGYAQTSALDLRSTAMPMKTAVAGLLDSGGGFSHMSNSRFNITWGEKMRPGQELIWTNLSVNQNGATKNNMIIGVLNSTYNGYTHGFRFDRFSNVKPQSDQDASVTVQAGITTTTAGQSCRLKYEHGTNRLKLEVVRSLVSERHWQYLIRHWMVIQSIFHWVETQPECLPQLWVFSTMDGRLLIHHLTITTHGRTGELVVSLRVKLILQLVFTLEILLLFLTGQQTKFGDTRMVWHQDIRCIGLVQYLKQIHKLVYTVQIVLLLV